MDNYGIVTTDDVRDVCNVCIELPRWVKTGRLESVGRGGVYRLAQYTPSEYDQYVKAVAVVGKEPMVYGASVLAMHNLAQARRTPQQFGVTLAHHVQIAEIS